MGGVERLRLSRRLETLRTDFDEISDLHSVSYGIKEPR
jgi:hypothetical protein